MARNTPFDLEQYRNEMEKLIGRNSDSDVFWRALDFAVAAHDDQWRKSGDAYILHPCSVAKIMVEEMDVDYGEILAAALLHDTVEDVEEVTPDVVEEKFGSYVRAIVEGCTKVTHVSGDRQLRSRKTHRKIFSGAAERPEVMLVKLADRLHNLRTLEALSQSRRQRIADETLAIYAPLAGALGLFNMKRDMYELAIGFRYRKKAKDLRNHIARLKKSPLGKSVVAKLAEATADAGLFCDVNIRTKGLWAYYDVKNKALLEQIDTPQEITLLVTDVAACYSALGILNRSFAPIPRTIRDFIANPKQTGYQGLHARAIIEGQKFFFKIRTRDMERKAQRGLFRNWNSKEEQQGRFIKEIQEMFDILGNEESVSYRDVIEASGIKEIYTYTPKGKLIYLPKGSSLLDFAFKVHPKIGLSCIGGMIRNKKLSPSYVLKDGDMVRVLRAEEDVHFEQDMLDWCKTPRARIELAQSFRKRRGKVTSEIGKRILAQELSRYRLTIDLFEKKLATRVWDSFTPEKAAHYYRGIGEGRYHLRWVIGQLSVFAEEKWRRRGEGKSAHNSIELTTLDPVTVKLSSCCKPEPASDENLMGLLTDKGISVHNENCKRFRELQLSHEDVVAVRWKKKKTLLSKLQTYHILAASRMELLAAVATAPAEMEVDRVEMLSSRTAATPAWEIVFSCPNLYALEKINSHFRQQQLPVEFIVDV